MVVSVDTEAVEDLQLDRLNRATMHINAGERGVLVVLDATNHTDEPAFYQVHVSHS